MSSQNVVADDENRLTVGIEAKPAALTLPLQVPEPPLSPATRAAFYSRLLMEELNANMADSPMSPWSLMKLMDPMAWIPGGRSIDDAPFEWLLKLPRRGLHHQIAKESKGVDGGYLGEIPHISAEGLNRETFAPFMKTNTPVLLKGFLKDTRAVREWSLPWISQHYGTLPVSIIRTETGICNNGDRRFDTTLAEGIAMMLRGEPVYMFGSSKLLHNHPELVDEHLETQRVADLCSPAIAYKDETGVRPHIMQVFMGGAGGGSSLHCASATNMTLQVCGVKRWKLVPPQYTPYLYPRFKAGVYCDSPVELEKTPAELAAEGHGLGRFVPHYTAHLEPGDVLFNAAWWWHSVDTLSDSSLAVAHRFMADHVFAGNVGLQLANMTSPHATRVLLDYVRSGKSFKDEDLLHQIFPSEHQDQG